jgi:hypothetical protein
MYVATNGENASSFGPSCVYRISSSSNIVTYFFCISGAIMGNGNSQQLVYDPANSDVYVITSNTLYISFVLSDTNAGASIRGPGADPRCMAFNEENENMYLGDSGTWMYPADSGIYVLSSANVLLSHVDTGVPSTSNECVYDPVNNYVYVTAYSASAFGLSGGVSVISNAFSLVGSQIQVGIGAGPILFDPFNNEVYVCSPGSIVILSS